MKACSARERPLSEVLQSLARRVDPPRAARVEWLLDTLLRGAEGLDPAAAREAMGPAYPNIESFLRMMRFWRGRLGDHDATALVEASEERIELALRDGKDRPWRLVVRCEPEPPHRIAMYGISRELPSGVRIRVATEADADALEAVERESPILQDDGTRVTILRGRGYFDQMRLMDQCYAVLVEDAGRPIAFDAMAIHTARYHGRRFRTGYRHHTRVSSDHQRLGLNEAMMTFRQEQVYRELLGGGYVYVDPHNDVIKAWSPTPPWSHRPFRALLACADVAGPPRGRPAEEADLARAARWLNALHDREVMYPGYDAARLGERLRRLPAYGLQELRMGDGAVVGVWQSGERVVRESPRGRSESVRAWVLDYGLADPYAASELEGLLRGWCGELSARGVTHLSLFATEASPAAPLLRGLAETVSPIEFQSGMPEPHDLEASGLYVDHVYW